MTVQELLNEIDQLSAKAANARYDAELDPNFDVEEFSAIDKAADGLLALVQLVQKTLKAKS